MGGSRYTCGMTTIGMFYDIIPGKEDQFVNAFRGVIDVLKSVDGHVESHVYQDVDQQGSYVILSQWTDKHTYGQFLASDAFKKTVTWGKENILRGRPRHKVYGEE